MSVPLSRYLSSLPFLPFPSLDLRRVPSRRFVGTSNAAHLPSLGSGAHPNTFGCSCLSAFSWPSQHKLGWFHASKRPDYIQTELLSARTSAS